MLLHFHVDFSKEFEFRMMCQFIPLRLFCEKEERVPGFAYDLIVLNWVSLFSVICGIVKKDVALMKLCQETYRCG